jgi:hypothetical protein
VQAQARIGDPDEGLEIKKEVTHRLKAHKKLNKPRISMKQVAKKYDIKLR